MNNAINAYQLENLKNQLQQELHTLLTEKFIHDPYNKAYLRDFIYQKVQEFEHKNYQNMLDYNFDVRIDESAIEYGNIRIDVAIVPKAAMVDITNITTISSDTIQNRNEQRKVMKKKINKKNQLKFNEI